MNQDSNEEWRELPVEETPRPTVTPFFAALGITLFFWGLVSSVVMIAVGLVILILALGRWIASINSNPHDDGR